jgi:hypothetical protein
MLRPSTISGFEKRMKRRVRLRTMAKGPATLGLTKRESVEAYRVDALRAAPDSESSRSVAFNICSRNRPLNATRSHRRRGDCRLGWPVIQARAYEIVRTSRCVQVDEAS